MERDANEARSCWQVCWPPRFVAGFIVERRREIPGAGRVALSLFVGPNKGLAAHDLYGHRVLMGHDPGFERAVEGSEQEVVSLRPQVFGGIQFFGGWLEQRELVVFLFTLESLQGSRSRADGRGLLILISAASSGRQTMMQSGRTSPKRLCIFASKRSTSSSNFSAGDVLVRARLRRVGQEGDKRVLDEKVYAEARSAPGQSR